MFSQKIRKTLLQKCGLPDILETKHCFADSTHHTCCLLGSKARQYADSTGNPIGKLSERVQGKKIGKLVPWCSCTGSKVCSYYSSKFGKIDGTKIKFIGTLKPRRTQIHNNKDIKDINSNQRNKAKNKNTKNTKNNNKSVNNSKNNSKNNSRNNSRNEWNENNAIKKIGLIQHKTPGITYT